MAKIIVTKKLYEEKEVVGAILGATFTSLIGGIILGFKFRKENDKEKIDDVIFNKEISNEILEKNINDLNDKIINNLKDDEIPDEETFDLIKKRDELRIKKGQHQAVIKTLEKLKNDCDDWIHI